MLEEGHLTYTKMVNKFNKSGLNSEENQQSIGLGWQHTKSLHDAAEAKSTQEQNVKSKISILKEQQDWEILPLSDKVEALLTEKIKPEVHRNKKSKIDVVRFETEIGIILKTAEEIAMYEEIKEKVRNAM